jgi:citrate lyase subunit beta/citryl-CoA lyase
VSWGTILRSFVPSPSSDRPVRSWLFAPGHNERILAKAFAVGADAVLLDLEDGVGPELKGQARAMVRDVLEHRPAWVRVNRPTSRDAELDLEVVGGIATGIRIPKVESAADLGWVRARLGGRDVPLIAAIESAVGVLRAAEIAASPGVAGLTFGNIDYGADIGVDPGDLDTMAVPRSMLVLASRAAGIGRPSDGVFTQFRDDDGLRAAAIAAKRLGFFGKSAIHPRQVPIINEVFSPSASELAWARRVVAAYEESRGAATSVGDGEMVDVPVYERARGILDSGP